MPKIPLPVLYSRTLDDSGLPDAVGARLVDGYVENLTGMSQPNIRKRFGLTLFCDLESSAPVDGLYWWDAKGVVIAVSGGNVFKVSSSDGNCSSVTGDALSVIGHTTFADNGSYIVMASGGRMITYDNSSPTAFMADADAPTAVSHVGYMDRYILANVYGTTRFQWSDVNAPLTWTSTSYADPESKPDILLALHIGWREITLFGKESIEIWYNDGTNPFSRLEGAYVERGCAAAHSIVNAGGVWVWLDHERRISMLEGRTVKLISGPYDGLIRNINSVADAYANFISIGGHAFYLLTFPSENLTVAYDLATDSWAEWGYWDNTTGVHQAWLGKSYCYATRWQFHLVGDRTTGKIYKLDISSFLDCCNEIRTVIRTGQVSHGTLKNKRSDSLLMRCKRGVGGVGEDEPVAEVRWRNDNGNWGKIQRVGLGKIGEREMVKKLSRLGMYRARQYEIIHSAESDFVISDLEEEVEVLR